MTPWLDPRPHDPVVLEVWIPGAIVNPLNQSAWGLWKHRRRTRTQREKAAGYLLVALRNARWTVPPATPKRVTFTRTGFNAMDSDGYQAACKPYRDALMDMAVIDDDRDSAGHTFAYAQRIDRSRKALAGVMIRVELRADAPQTYRL